MIHGQPRPTLNNAIEVGLTTINQIIRTLDTLPYLQDRNTVIYLYRHGKNVVLVYTGGYDYPRYKTPRIACDAYESMCDYALERLMKCKAIGEDVDFVIGGAQTVTK